jgi:hypothetical protein
MTAEGMRAVKRQEIGTDPHKRVCPLFAFFGNDSRGNAGVIIILAALSFHEAL